MEVIVLKRGGLRGAQVTLQTSLLCGVLLDVIEESSCEPLLREPKYVQSSEWDSKGKLLLKEKAGFQEFHAGLSLGLH